MNPNDTHKDIDTEHKQQNRKTWLTKALFSRSNKRSNLSLTITTMLLTLLVVSGCSSTATTNPSSATDAQTTATTESPATSDSASSQEATIDKGTDSPDSSTESTPTDNNSATDATDTQAPNGADTTSSANDKKASTNESTSTNAETKKEPSSSAKNESSSTAQDKSSTKSSTSSSTSAKESTETTKDQTSKTTKDQNASKDKPSSKPSTSTTKPSTATPKESSSSAPVKTPPVATPQPQASTATLSITGDSNILGATAVSVEAGESALDLLKRVTRSKGIPMEYQGSSGFAYVEGIDNLYEFDEGPTSGWMFKVNGNFPNMSAGAYKVQVGDRIDWLYTTDLGKDVGAKN